MQELLNFRERYVMSEQLEFDELSQDYEIWLDEVEQTLPLQEE